MNKVFYPRIAMINLRNNGRTYVPYLLTCILSTAMFYVICSLSLNPDLDTMLGGGYMRTLLQMGTWIVGFFVIIFLFYTNSFLMKRRKKEFGVFNILGMEKRHISKVIAYETLFTALVSLLAGISLGIVLERLLYYALGAMMAGGGALTFNISVEGIRTTLILFAIIHLLIFLSSRWQIRLANPIQLLHGSSYGEREPKARWLMALLGLISLGAGYAIAVLTKNPLNALLLFFVAVLLVIWLITYLMRPRGPRPPRGGGGGSSKPTVDIPDDVPTGLNGDDHFAYIVGYPNGNVEPNGNITRAEVATIFFRLLTEEVRTANSTQSNSLSDVTRGQWFNHAVSTLSSMGIVKGHNDGTFAPNAPITRAEFAAIAARFDDKNTDMSSKFTDIASHWAKNEIGIAANKGWINGYPDGTFRPNQYITRAEAMTLVNRVLNRLPENSSDLLDSMIKWPDNSDASAWYYLAVQEATNSHAYSDKSKDDKYEKWTTIRDARDWTELEK